MTQDNYDNYDNYNSDNYAQTTIPPYQLLGQRDWAVARWNGEPYIQIYIYLLSTMH